MTAMPNLYLKWRAFRELADVNDPDNWIGKELFKTEDGAQRFSKLLRGDLGCSPAIAENLIRFMNDWIGVARSRADKSSKAAASPATLAPGDLDLPVLTFVARLIGELQAAAEKNLDRAHQALLADMTLEAPRGDASPQCWWNDLRQAAHLRPCGPPAARGRSCSRRESIKDNWR